MQQVIIKDIKAATGTGKKGKWTLIIIVGEDGAEFTSFDAALSKLVRGSVIEVEPEIITKDGKTKVNIKEWKLVKEAIAPLAASSSSDNMTPEMWEEKERKKRRSIERQASAEIAVEIIEKPTTLEKWREAADYIFHWIADSRTPALAKPQDAQKPTTDNVAGVTPLKKDKPMASAGLTLGKVLTWCASHGKTYDRTWFFKNMSYTEVELKEPVKLENAIKEIRQLTDWTDEIK